jgi:hypothetical protein
VTSTSTTSLRDRVDSITAENTTGEPVAPPRIASLSPFHEILTRDIAAGLPPELGALMSATPSMNELMDWIAAGAMLRWVDDAHSRKVYLDELQHDPRRASLSLARAVASRMEPPRREPAWRRLDLAGLVLQVAIAVALCFCRGVLVTMLAFWLSGQPVPHDWLAFIPAGLFDRPLLLNPASPGVAFASALLVVAMWHAFEVRWALRWMEEARQLPLRMKDLPPSAPWRLDTFQAAWLLQSATLWLLVGLSIGQQALSSTISTSDGEVRVAFVVILGLFLLTSRILFRRLVIFAKIVNNTTLEANNW